MSFHTSHAALISLAGIVATNVLTSICGSPVDLNLINVPAVTASLVALFLDMKKRWNVVPT